MEPPDSPDSLFKEERVTHLVRLPKPLDERMMFRCRTKYGGNVQLYLTSLVERDVELPDLPDCTKCGFRSLAESILAHLRAGGKP
jgi:hypothetical protein